jgi:hypothetical protein
VSDRGGLLVRTRTTVIDWPTAKPAEAATGMTVAFTVVLLVPRFKARKTFHVGLPEGQVHMETGISRCGLQAAKRSHRRGRQTGRAGHTCRDQEIAAAH